MNFRRMMGWMSVIVVLANAACAAETPGVGAVAPEFALRSVAGERVQLKALREKGPVVLVVLRGYPGYQCPLCTRQVNEFVGQAQAFAAKGAQVVMVYPGPAAELEKRAGEFLANKEWPREFGLLLDPDYGFTNAYGLRWDAPKETAYPATFVIGRDGKVIWSKVSRTHGGRTSAAEVLRAL